MKLRHRALMLIGMLSVAPLGYAQADDEATNASQNATTTLQEVKKETQDLLQSIGSYTADQKTEAVNKAKEGLNNLDNRIDALEANIERNWDQMDTAARQKARASLQALHKQRNQVAEWYGSLKSGTQGAWGHLKQGFTDAYKDFNAAWEESDAAVVK
ncbi:MAG: septal ring factor EnvC (AmiA/AmiB activator) [Motiliproteus sp.]|jgi:septal ring factor EnvC (AmiA/AmiB activator)